MDTTTWQAKFGQVFAAFSVWFSRRNKVRKVGESFVLCVCVCSGYTEQPDAVGGGGGCIWMGWGCFVEGSGVVHYIK